MGVEYSPLYIILLTLGFNYYPTLMYVYINHVIIRGIVVAFQSCVGRADEGCVAIVCNVTDVQRSTRRVTIDAIPDNRQFFVSTT